MDGRSNARGRSLLTGMGNMKKVIKRTKEGALQMFHARLVRDPSLSCRVYPSGWSFNHVLTRLLNYQAAAMLLNHQSRWFGTNVDWCTLAEAGLGVEVVNSPSHLVNTFAMCINAHYLV